MNKAPSTSFYGRRFLPPSLLGEEEMSGGFSSTTPFPLFFFPLVLVSPFSLNNIQRTTERPAAAAAAAAAAAWLSTSRRRCYVAVDYGDQAIAGLWVRPELLPPFL